MQLHLQKVLKKTKDQKLSVLLLTPFVISQSVWPVGSLYLFKEKKIYFLENSSQLCHNLTMWLSASASFGNYFSFLEIFITGIGYKFERILFEGRVGFSLFLGLKGVFLIKPPSFFFLIGLNKKKVVLCSTNSLDSRSFASVVQKLRMPTKYFMQGVNLRFKFRRIRKPNSAKKRK